MKKEDIEIEMEVLALLFFATCDQKLMVDGFLRQNSKRKLNMWVNHGNSLLKELNLEKNEEYMMVLTDTLHLQMDEIRKVIKQLKNKNK